jgi:uncharacterized protein YjcR
MEARGRHHYKELKISAKSLFDQGWSYGEVASYLKIPESTAHSWKQKLGYKLKSKKSSHINKELSIIPIVESKADRSRGNDDEVRYSLAELVKAIVLTNKLSRDHS